jgi:uncharacterized protein YndB with AHSA1/START domain
VTGDPGGLILHLEKVLQAPTERVFAACVEPEKVAEWWGPAGFTTLSVDLDVRVGGRYRITMRPPDGEAFHLRGRYSEVDPPRRLVYTFEWEEPDPDDQETVVTLSLLDDREGTKLVLNQGPFATEARHALHEAGWTETLERLERFLA